MEDKKLEKILIDTFAGSFFFTKYPELVNGKDVGDGSMPFVEGGYNSQTIVAETMRFFPVANAVGANFLFPNQAPLEQVDIWNKNEVGFHSIYFYDNEKPDSYISLLTEPSSENKPYNPNPPAKSLHVLHPYAKIPLYLYAVDPKVLLWLNTKSNLSELTDHTPKKALLNLEQITELKPPFVLKKLTGSSGDGVKIIKSEEDIKGISSFVDQERVIAEEYIDYAENYGVNFVIDKSGIPHFLGYCKQHTTPAGEFCGAIGIFDKAPPEGLVDVTKKTCLEVAKRGYYGFLGFDVLQDKKGDFYIIDPNVRCTAATPIYVMKDKIAPKLGPKIYCGSSQMNAENPDEIITKINYAGGMLLSMSHQIDGMYKFFCMFGGNSCEEAFNKWAKFNKK